MAAPDLSGLIHFGYNVLRTTVADKTKKILAQLGDVGGPNSDDPASTDSDNADWVQHVGFASRPSKAVPPDAAQVVVIRGGDRDTCIASQDLRGLELYGQLKEGESCVYAPGEAGKGQARALFKADGSIHLYTRKGNTESGKGMTIQMDAAAGAIRMLNDLGHAIIIDESGITLTVGEAALVLGSDGSATLTGTGATQVDGKTVVLGSNVLPVVNSALKGPTGVAGVASLKVLIE
jgi:hypothetical protein